MTSTRPSPAEEAEQALLRRWPENRLEPSLDRIRALTDALGRPQHAVPVVHVTGTNGKTTTARVIHDLLRGSGLRVGRYTSPHLHSVRERIVLDGLPIDAARFADVHARLRPMVEEVDAANDTPLSFFEVVTAMAFVAFAEADLDAVVLEVGMGGTWDATNVVDGRIAVVTPISLDHTEYLGPDEAAIATEKAGIIKPSSTVVLADQPEPASSVLLERAAALGATVVRAGIGDRILRRVPDADGQVLDVRAARGVHRGLRLPLLGVHQAANAAVALAATESFLAAGGRRLDTGTVRSVLSEVRAPGRLETVRTSPRVWVDASHNPAGMAATVAAIRELPSPARVVVVLAVLADKDVTGMLHALGGLATQVVVSETDSPRRLPADRLGAVAVELLGSARVMVEPDLGRALARALASAEADPAPAAVLVTGSVVTAAEAGKLLGTGGADAP